MAAKGVAPESVNYVAIGAPNVRAQALLSGQIDVTTMSLATWVNVQNEKGIKSWSTRTTISPRCHW